MFVVNQPIHWFIAISRKQLTSPWIFPISFRNFSLPFIVTEWKYSDRAEIGNRIRRLEKHSLIGAYSIQFRINFPNKCMCVPKSVIPPVCAPVCPCVLKSVRSPCGTDCSPGAVRPPFKITRNFQTICTSVYCYFCSTGCKNWAICALFAHSSFRYCYFLLPSKREHFIRPKTGNPPVIGDFYLFRSTTFQLAVHLFRLDMAGISRSERTICCHAHIDLPWYISLMPWIGQCDVWPQCPIRQ